MNEIITLTTSSLLVALEVEAPPSPHTLEKMLNETVGGVVKAHNLKADDKMDRPRGPAP